MAEAEHVTYRIAVIDHGRIVAEGTAAALREQTGGRTLEDAFIALTGHSIRGDETRPNFGGTISSAALRRECGRVLKQGFRHWRRSFFESDQISTPSGRRRV